MTFLSAHWTILYYCQHPVEVFLFALSCSPKGYAYCFELLSRQVSRKDSSYRRSIESPKWKELNEPFIHPFVSQILFFILVYLVYLVYSYRREKNELSSKFASCFRRKSFHCEAQKKRTAKRTKATHSICVTRIQYVDVLLGNYATFHNKASEKKRRKNFI